MRIGTASSRGARGSRHGAGLSVDSKPPATEHPAAPADAGFPERRWPSAVMVARSPCFRFAPAGKGEGRTLRGEGTVHMRCEGPSWSRMYGEAAAPERCDPARSKGAPARQAESPREQRIERREIRRDDIEKAELRTTRSMQATRSNAAE